METVNGAVMCAADGVYDTMPDVPLSDKRPDDLAPFGGGAPRRWDGGAGMSDAHVRPSDIVLNAPI